MASVKNNGVLEKAKDMGFDSATNMNIIFKDAEENEWEVHLASYDNVTWVQEVPTFILVNESSTRLANGKETLKILRIINSGE